MITFVIGFCLSLIITAIICEKAHRAEINDLRNRIADQGSTDVYVLVTHLIVNGDDTEGIKVTAYLTEEEATKAFINWKANERQCCIDNEWNILAEDATTWEACEAMDWPMNHSCAYIHKFEL